MKELKLILVLKSKYRNRTSKKAIEKSEIVFGIRINLSSMKVWINSRGYLSHFSFQFPNVSWARYSSMESWLIHLSQWNKPISYRVRIYKTPTSQWVDKMRKVILHLVRGIEIRKKKTKVLRHTFLYRFSSKYHSYESQNGRWALVWISQRKFLPEW